LRMGASRLVYFRRPGLRPAACGELRALRFASTSPRPHGPHGPGPHGPGSRPLLRRRLLDFPLQSKAVTSPDISSGWLQSTQKEGRGLASEAPRPHTLTQGHDVAKDSIQSKPYTGGSACCAEATCQCNDDETRGHRAASEAACRLQNPRGRWSMEHPGRR